MKKKIYSITFLLIFFVAIFTASPLVYSVTKTSLSGNITQRDIPFNNPDTVYYIEGNLTIDCNPQCNNAGTHTGIVFVSGDININADYCYGPANCATSTPVAGLIGAVFVAKGNIYIDKSVTRIDAVLISEGIICTASVSGSCPPGLTNPAETQQLVVNGSLISINKTTQCPSNCPIKFRRTLTNNSIPAEKINHQVKYLVILRNLFSDTWQKWSEIP